MHHAPVRVYVTDATGGCLLANARTFSAGSPTPRVVLETAPGAEPTLVVRDNGVGFDMTYVDTLFRPIERLHRPDDFEGRGIGLATVRRIIAGRGGRIWAESAHGIGAASYCTLP